MNDRSAEMGASTFQAPQAPPSESPDLLVGPRLWDGLDPVEPGPQPSRPTPAFGAPDIGQRHFKEDPMLYAFANGDGGGDKQPAPTPQEPAK